MTNPNSNANQNFSMGNNQQGALSQVQQAFEQMPPQQRQEVMNQFMQFMQQNNMQPHQAGVQHTDQSHPNYGNAQDMTRAVQHAAQQNPDALQQALGPGGVLNNKMVQAGAVAALALAANHFLGKR